MVHSICSAKFHRCDVRTVRMSPVDLSLIWDRLVLSSSFFLVVFVPMWACHVACVASAAAAAAAACDSMTLGACHVRVRVSIAMRVFRRFDFVFCSCDCDVCANSVVWGKCDLLVVGSSSDSVRISFSPPRDLEAWPQ